MLKEPIGMRISFELKAIQADIAKYFDQHHSDIDAIISSEITPNKIIIALQEAIKNELKLKVRWALEEKVKEVIRNNTALTKVLDKHVTKIIEKKNKKK